jgi:hypothetical protein
MSNQYITSKIDIKYFLTKEKRYKIEHTYKSNNGLQFEIINDKGMRKYYSATYFILK